MRSWMQYKAEEVNRRESSLAIERENVNAWTQAAAVHEAGYRELQGQVMRLKDALGSIKKQQSACWMIAHEALAALSDPCVPGQDKET